MPMWTGGKAVALLVRVGVVSAFLVAASPAAAEIVFFATGRTMNVKGHLLREDGRIVLQLRDGGEIVTPAAVITAFAPDEVAYPEPKAAIVTPVPGDEESPLQLRPEQLRYSQIIDRVAAEQGVDVRLVHAVIEVESNYQERARSPKGAKGLMQLMPQTARQYSVKDPYDPVANIEAGIKHLKSLLVRYTQNIPLALAAYNAGEAAVERFKGVPPYPETRNYVARILKILG
ncbi:MAG TPA: lytic transglycosylase domain-containing protein [Vicinamibacterales bacterium]|nr:lytic transglycosylase domain-containing protein [Vicinamibacterales bacterium]